MRENPATKRSACSTARRRRRRHFGQRHAGEEADVGRHQREARRARESSGGRPRTRPADPSAAGSLTARPPECPGRGGGTRGRARRSRPDAAGAGTRARRRSSAASARAARSGTRPPCRSEADEVLVVRLLRHRLVALEPFAEVVSPHQPASHQHVERAVDRRRADPLALVLESSLNRLDREVLLGHQDVWAIRSRWRVTGRRWSRRCRRNRSRSAGPFSPSKPGHRRPERTSRRG